MHESLRYNIPRFCAMAAARASTNACTELQAVIVRGVRHRGSGQYDLPWVSYCPQLPATLAVMYVASYVI